MLKQLEPDVIPVFFYNKLVHQLKHPLWVHVSDNLWYYDQRVQNLKTLLHRELYNAAI